MAVYKSPQRIQEEIGRSTTHVRGTVKIEVLKSPSGLPYTKEKAMNYPSLVVGEKENSVVIEKSRLVDLRGHVGGFVVDGRGGSSSISLIIGGPFSGHALQLPEWCEYQIGRDNNGRLMLVVMRKET